MVFYKLFHSQQRLKNTKPCTSLISIYSLRKLLTNEWYYEKEVLLKKFYLYVVTPQDLLQNL